MKITEALSQSTLRTELYSSSPELVHFDGAIEGENDKNFRIYPNPRKRNRFFRVSVEDVVGDVYQYSTEQMHEAGVSPRFGFTPHNEVTMYQIPVKHGAKIEYITIQEAEAGISYPMEAVEGYQQNRGSGNSGGCNCGSKKADTEMLSLCRFMSPCPSGCCMTKFGNCECSSSCNSDCTYP